MSGGVQKGFQRFAYTYSTYPAPDGATHLGIIVNALIGYNDPATAAAFGTGLPQTAKSTAVSVTDGVSNTILIDEVAGRNTLYAGTTPILSATAALGANSPVLKEAALGSGGWADQINVNDCRRRQSGRGVGQNGPRVRTSLCVGHPFFRD